MPLPSGGVPINRRSAFFRFSEADEKIRFFISFIFPKQFENRRVISGLYDDTVER